MAVSMACGFRSLITLALALSAPSLTGAVYCIVVSANARIAMRMHVFLTATIDNPADTAQQSHF